MDVGTLPCVAEFVGVVVVEFCARGVDGGSAVASVFGGGWAVELEE